MFDDLYVFSNNDVAACRFTSAGIILIDTTYDGTVRELIVDRMAEAGLDAGQIKSILLTHGHSDHAGGAKHLHET